MGKRLYFLFCKTSISSANIVGGKNELHHPGVIERFHLGLIFNPKQILNNPKG